MRLINFYQNLLQMLLNLTITCNFIHVGSNALQTPTTCLTYVQKAEPNGKKLTSSFRTEYADVQAFSEDRHGLQVLPYYQYLSCLYHANADYFLQFRLHSGWSINVIASEYHVTWPRRCLTYATFKNESDLDLQDQDHTKNVILKIRSIKRCDLEDQDRAHLCLSVSYQC